MDVPDILKDYYETTKMLEFIQLEMDNLKNLFNSIVDRTPVGKKDNITKNLVECIQTLDFKFHLSYTIGLLTKKKLMLEDILIPPSEQQRIQIIDKLENKYKILSKIKIKIKIK